MTDPAKVFDRAAVRRHRDRAARAPRDRDFLFAEVADRLSDRLYDVSRNFALGLALGDRDGVMRRALGGTRKVDRLVSTDLSPALLTRGGGSGPQDPQLAADEEFLPVAEASLDLVLAPLSLHWVNDLPGALIQIRRALKPDGLLLGALLGGDTLVELRRAFMEAEAEIEGGASPRAAPVADVRDLGALLQRAGFALPVVDSETLTVTYADPVALMQELRGMGETNAVAARRRTFLRRATLIAMAERYATLYATDDGRIPASFEILTLTAWAPHDTQQKPLRPGSAAQRLADALETEEKPAGEKAGPKE